MAKKILIICQVVLLSIVFCGCRGNAPPDENITGADIGVYYVTTDDGTQPVGIDGKPISGYKLESGKLVVDGKEILLEETIEQFVPTISANLDIGNPEIEIDTSVNRDFEITIVGKCAINPINATSRKLVIKTSDPGVIYLGSKRSSLTVNADDKGEAQFSVTIRSLGTTTITVIDASSESVLCTQDYVVKAAESSVPENATTLSDSSIVSSGDKVTPPVIVQNPLSIAVMSKSSISFTAKASNAISCEWYARSPNNGTYIKAADLIAYFNGLEVTGYQTDTLTLGKIPKELNGWVFRCLYTNSKGVTFSGDATLTVIPGEEGEQLGDWIDISQSIITPEHTHEYTTVVVPPTYTDRGYTIYTCACGHTYNGDFVEPLVHVHSYSSDCIDGKIVYTCVECGFSYTV